MPTYKIPVYYQMYGYYDIEAESLKEAMEQADEQCLPPDADYVDGSFVIETELIPEVNDEGTLTPDDLKYLSHA